jgi:molybdenum cofactor cytidylyltransferase
MGEPKLLLDFLGKTVFETALANHTESSISSVCAVVAGWIPGFGDIVARYAGERVEFLKITKPCSMSDSLKHGWRRLQESVGPDAVMISLGDMPLVKPGTIDRLIERFLKSGKPICVPVWENRWGHPVVISSGLGDEIMELEGDQGAKDVLARHRHDVERVAVDSSEVLIDIDCPRDRIMMLSRLESNERR